MIPRFRDHAANERTYLAWVRTAITIMAFGFLLERFDLLLALGSASPVRGGTAPLPAHAAEWVGLLLIVFGALMILLASMRFVRHRGEIDTDGIHPHVIGMGEKLLTSILLVVAAFLVFYVFQEIPWLR